MVDHMTSNFESDSTDWESDSSEALQRYHTKFARMSERNDANIRPAEISTADSYQLDSAVSHSGISLSRLVKTPLPEPNHGLLVECNTSENVQNVIEMSDSKLTENPITGSGQNTNGDMVGIDGEQTQTVDNRVMKHKWNHQVRFISSTRGINHGRSHGAYSFPMNPSERELRQKSLAVRFPFEQVLNDRVKLKYAPIEFQWNIQEKS